MPPSQFASKELEAESVAGAAGPRAAPQIGCQTKRSYKAFYASALARCLE